MKTPGIPKNLTVSLGLDYSDPNGISDLYVTFGLGLESFRQDNVTRQQKAAKRSQTGEGQVPVPEHLPELHPEVFHHGSDEICLNAGHEEKRQVTIVER
jgi:hypothetical protein